MTDSSLKLRHLTDNELKILDHLRDLDDKGVIVPRKLIYKMLGPIDLDNLSPSALGKLLTSYHVLNKYYNNIIRKRFIDQKDKKYRFYNDILDTVQSIAQLHSSTFDIKTNIELNRIKLNRLTTFLGRKKEEVSSVDIQLSRIEYEKPTVEATLSSQIDKVVIGHLAEVIISMETIIKDILNMNFCSSSLNSENLIIVIDSIIKLQTVMGTLSKYQEDKNIDDEIFAIYFKYVSDLQAKLFGYLLVNYDHLMNTGYTIHDISEDLYELKHELTEINDKNINLTSKIVSKIKSKKVDFNDIFDLLSEYRVYVQTNRTQSISIMTKIYNIFIQTFIIQYVILDENIVRCNEFMIGYIKYLIEYCPIEKIGRMQTFVSTFKHIVYQIIGLNIRELVDTNIESRSDKTSKDDKLHDPSYNYDIVIVQIQKRFVIKLDKILELLSLFDKALQELELEQSYQIINQMNILKFVILIIKEILNGITNKDDKIDLIQSLRSKFEKGINVDHLEEILRMRSDYMGNIKSNRLMTLSTLTTSIFSESPQDIDIDIIRYIYILTDIFKLDPHGDLNIQRAVTDNGIDKIFPKRKTDKDSMRAICEDVQKENCAGFVNVWSQIRNIPDLYLSNLMKKEFEYLVKLDSLSSTKSTLEEKGDDNLQIIMNQEISRMIKKPQKILDQMTFIIKYDREFDNIMKKYQIQATKFTDMVLLKFPSKIETDDYLVIWNMASLLRVYVDLKLLTIKKEELDHNISDIQKRMHELDITIQGYSQVGGFITDENIPKAYQQLDSIKRKHDDIYSRINPVTTLILGGTVTDLPVDPSLHNMYSELKKLIFEVSKIEI
jgi:hypothetical protein